MHKQFNNTDPEKDGPITPTYASRFFSQSLPKYSIPLHGLMPEVAYQIIKDELQLDGNAHMNLATFVTTWMEPQAIKLMSETFDKNIIDKDEYPQTAEIEQRCVNILAKLWNAPGDGNAIGGSTIGSSEACMLAGLAFKWRWRKRMEAQNKDATKPNLVLGRNAQICWDKFCRYWDVEPRFVDLEEGRYHIDVKKAVELCDENTIGVIGILGSTLDGSYEPIQELASALDEFERKTGLDIPIHVDGASGGFIAPFLDSEIVWDFRLPRVASINTSGHKYGMVYPGVGWIVWQNVEDLPEELIFKVNYLGGEMPTFTLNFSKPGNGVIAQYYNFLRLGFEGYKQIQQRCRLNAQMIATSLGRMGYFKIISNGDNLPVVTFTNNDNISLYKLSERLRLQGWQVPAYTMAPNIEEMVVMRIVVKENFSSDMANTLLKDIKIQSEHILNNNSVDEPKTNSAFHH